jgi:hypothetical protein
MSSYLKSEATCSPAVNLQKLPLNISPTLMLRLDACAFESGGGWSLNILAVEKLKNCNQGNETKEQWAPDVSQKKLQISIA